MRLLGTVGRVNFVAVEMLGDLGGGDFAVTDPVEWLSGGGVCVCL